MSSEIMNKHIYSRERYPKSKDWWNRYKVNLESVSFSKLNLCNIAFRVQLSTTKVHWQIAKSGTGVATHLHQAFHQEAAIPVPDLVVHVLWVKPHKTRIYTIWILIIWLKVLIKVWKVEKVKVRKKKDIMLAAFQIRRRLLQGHIII